MPTNPEDLLARIMDQERLTLEALRDWRAKAAETIRLHREFDDLVRSGQYDAGAASPRPADGQRNRTVRAATATAPSASGTTVAESSLAVNASPDELRREYRRLWHHAKKGGDAAVAQFKREWDARFGRGSKRERGTASA